jgi:two-component SAPR family response regulator
MKVVIIEDEEFAARRLERMITEISPEIQVLVRLESVAESVEWFKQNALPDLIFMDVHLEDNLSFAIFEHVTLNCPIVFTTATDEKSTVVFRQNQLDYLLKPIGADELRRVIQKYRDVDRQNWQPIAIEVFRKPDN